MNSINLIGRSTHDPELRYTAQGTAVTNFTVAVNDGYGDNQKAYYIDIVCWSKLAENVAKYVVKGSKVAVTGKLQTRNYEYNNQKRKATEVNAYAVEFLDAKSTNTSDYDNNASVNTPSNDEDYSQDDYEDDDLPF